MSNTGQSLQSSTVWNFRQSQKTFSTSSLPWSSMTIKRDSQLTRLKLILGCKEKLQLCKKFRKNSKKERRQFAKCWTMMVTTPKKLMCLKVTKKSMMKPSKDLVMLVATPLIFKMKGKSRFLTLTLKRTLAFILNFIQKFYLEDSFSEW